MLEGMGMIFVYLQYKKEMLLNRFVFFFFILLYVHGCFPVCICLCITWLPGVCGIQKRASDLLKLELLTYDNHHGNAGK